ncbi:MAG TPA: PKD domain-containing protein [Solirubrobacterales bacterium]
MAAVVPTEEGEPVIGPSLEGSGQLGGFSPADLRSAYTLPSSGGAGQTIAITIAFDDPNAESDLAVYRSHYGLPACTTANGCFRKVNQLGKEGKYPEPNSGWALETSLDLDMVSATCPECHILLVEANSNYTEDLGAAVDRAAEMGASVISNSWAAEEYAEEKAENHYFHHPGIPVLFASGDWGYGVYYPASSPDAIAVGGTSLKKAGNSRGWSETAWSGAGSGCSSYEEKPAWQKDGGCSQRTVADVSAVANPQTPVSVYDSYGQSGWVLLGGTSVATPLVAGIEALSTGTFRATGPSGFTRAGNNGALFDVIEGENGLCAAESETGFEGAYLCQADAGYDGPTGWGTPDGPQSLPVAVTELATVESTTTAALHGTIDPQGVPTKYRFEYGETTAYGTSVPIPDASVGAGSEYVDVAQTIEGLKGQTTYHYRIVAVASGKTSPGVDRTFGTTPPTVSTGIANEIHASSATLHATVNPEGLDSTYYFEYGPTASYGHKSPVKAGVLKAATKSVEVTAPVGGLEGATEYRYRIVAHNAAGTVYGKPGSFTTGPPDWTADYLPQPPNSGNGYRPFGVSCMQANRCVAVGENWSLDVHTRATLAEFWDGKSWSPMTTPDPPGLDEGWKHEWYAFFLGVSCTPNEDCVAVGRYRDPSETVKPLAEHWDGSEWVITSPAEPAGGTEARLESVSCTSAANCVAVGSYRNASNVQKTLAEHWDGSEWTIESAPNPGSASASRLTGVSCPTSTTCVAVGSYQSAGTERTLAVHLVDGAWTIHETPNPGTQVLTDLAQVSCSSPSQCSAVGYFQSGPSLVTLAERWNGVKWVSQSTPTPQGEGAFSGVSCATAGSCTAAGTYYESGGGWRPLVERWEGSTWSIPEITIPSAPAGWWHEAYFEAVSCPQPKACMAVASTLSAPEGQQAPYYALAEHETASVLGSFTFEPDVPHAGKPIGFDASGSSDPDHTIESYEWDFGDGSHGTGATPSHTYANGGDYTVTLTLADDEEETAKISHLVTVAASAPKFTLTVSREGSGLGSVTSSPGLISCDPFCSDEFDEGTEVTLTASPDPSSLFRSWRHCDAGGVQGRQCTVSMGEAKEVEAVFVTTHRLTLGKAGSGLGKVQTSPSGIFCPFNCSGAEAVFMEGDVTVKETATMHNHFVQWLGDCAGSEPTCTLDMSEDHEIEAEFAPDTRYTLSLAKEGSGQGSIKSKPAGLLCGYVCDSQSASFHSGENVEIEVKLGSGTTKVTWSTGAGTCTGSIEAATSTCTLPMSSAEELVATFD